MLLPNVLTKQQQETRVIRRYQNRKLYDLALRAYTTLDEIRRLIEEGKQVLVVSAQPGNKNVDVTADILAQVIAYARRDDEALPTIAELHETIRKGDGTLKSYLKVGGNRG